MTVYRPYTQKFAKFMLTNSELANFSQRYPICSLGGLKLNCTDDKKKKKKKKKFIVHRKKTIQKVI